MAGEDTTIHVVAYGPMGAAPRVRVPDPRKRDDQFALLLTQIPCGPTLWIRFAEICLRSFGGAVVHHQWIG
jgi:hypothetical protein